MTSERRLREGALAFVQHEATAGLLLLGATLAALLVSNSSLRSLYQSVLSAPAGLRLADFSLEKPVLLWINDGLMAIFFLLVGLEIKRELIVGELASPGKAALPGIAAVGGMAVPALIYSLINAGDWVALRGWAIPAATDIAFAVGVLALLGNRVPASLKIFLLALAILDDLGSILIIAVFYTGDLHWSALLLASLAAGALAALNRGGIRRLAPYLLIGLFIWLCVLKSGVHATLAGVVVAMAVPLRGGAPQQTSPLESLEARLHPWIAYLILPLFAFANAGVSLKGLSLAKLTAPVPLGIALGLLVGKPVGIFAASWLAVASGLAPRPEGANWRQLLGIGMLGGIGFTMSLFIGTLAFPDPAHAAQLRLGVLTGSLLSAIAGYCVLRFSAPRRP
ncbi:MAG TPA: Na+/H+ antiporter NhaA [Hyphomicrobiaceae bacterium]|jgi:NhaA family Na+:H+ antiporter|nr:Na+/H+ antiporter NhaA [Hyphomicrobiaceae bacterium]